MKPFIRTTGTKKECKKHHSSIAMLQKMYSSIKSLLKEIFNKNDRYYWERKLEFFLFLAYFSRVGSIGSMAWVYYFHFTFLLEKKRLQMPFQALQNIQKYDHSLLAAFEAKCIPNNQVCSHTDSSCCFWKRLCCCLHIVGVFASVLTRNNHVFDNAFQRSFWVANVMRQDAG